MSNFVQRFLVIPLVSVFSISVLMPSAALFDSAHAEEGEAGPDLWSYEQAYLANLNGFCAKGVWKAGE